MNITEIIFTKEYMKNPYTDRDEYKFITPVLYSEHRKFYGKFDTSHSKGYISLDDLRVKLALFIRNIKSPLYSFTCKFSDEKVFFSDQLLNADKRKDFIGRIQSIVKREINIDCLEFTAEYLEELFENKKTIEKPVIKAKCDKVHTADTKAEIDRLKAEIKMKLNQNTLIERKPAEKPVIPDTAENTALARAFERFAKNVR